LCALIQTKEDIINYLKISLMKLMRALIE